MLDSGPEMAVPLALCSDQRAVNCCVQDPSLGIHKAVLLPWGDSGQTAFGGSVGKAGPPFLESVHGGIPGRAWCLFQV